MPREEIQDLLFEATEDGNFNDVEYWKDAFHRMDEDDSEIWLS